MSWSLDTTAQRRFKIFLHILFQIWNFCGIFIFQEFAKFVSQCLALKLRLQYFLPRYPNPSTFDLLSWHSVFLISNFKEAFVTFSTSSLLRVCRQPSVILVWYFLLSWKFSPNLQCLYMSKPEILNAFIRGTGSMFPCMQIQGGHHLNVCTPISTTQGVGRERLGA